MTYNNAVKHILNLSQKASGGEHIRTLCSLLDSPQKQLKSIRICGDTGKTSCARMLISIMARGGYKVGYFSPSHFADMRECIKIGEKDIPHADFADLAKKFFDTASLHGMIEHLSQNEALLAIALLYFSSKECDAVIFERGNGDTSPFIDAPILSVITSIYDDVPPSRLDELVPRGTTETVTCIQHKQIYGDISKTCADTGCRLSLPLYADLEVKKITLFNTRFVYRGNEYTLGAFSPCQLLNAITVIEAAHALVRLGLNLPEATIAAGLANAHLPLMCQVLAIEPTIIIATVSTERQLETLTASLAQVGELLHGSIDVFVSSEVHKLTAELPARLASCAISCKEPTKLAPIESSDFKHQINDIITPLIRSEDMQYAAVFIADGSYAPDLAEQIKKILNNII